MAKNESPCERVPEARNESHSQREPQSANEPSCVIVTTEDSESSVESALIGNE